MSELRKLLEDAVLSSTGLQKPIPMRFHVGVKASDTLSSAATSGWEVARQLSINVRIHAETWLTDRALADSALDIKTQVKKEMIEKIITMLFGEFREHLDGIREGLYGGEFDIALKHLNALEERMFE